MENLEHLRGDDDLRCDDDDLESLVDDLVAVLHLHVHAVEAAQRDQGRAPQPDGADGHRLRHARVLAGRSAGCRQRRQGGAGGAG